MRNNPTMIGAMVILTSLVLAWAWAPAAGPDAGGGATPEAGGGLPLPKRPADWGLGQLLWALQSPYASVEECAAAIDELARRHDDPAVRVAVAPLVKAATGATALKASDERVRAHAVEALKKIIGDAGPKKDSDDPKAWAKWWEEHRAEYPGAAPDSTWPVAQLLAVLQRHDASPEERAAAIDELGRRHDDPAARAAVGPLVKAVADGTALQGSDNYVGAHAVHALKKIIGDAGPRDSYNAKVWDKWWEDHHAEYPAAPEPHRPDTTGPSGA